MASAPSPVGQASSRNSSFRRSTGGNRSGCGGGNYRNNGSTRTGSGGHWQHPQSQQWGFQQQQPQTQPWGFQQSALSAPVDSAPAWPNYIPHFPSPRPTTYPQW